MIRPNADSDISVAVPNSGGSFKFSAILDKLDECRPLFLTPNVEEIVTEFSTQDFLKNNDIYISKKYTVKHDCLLIISLVYNDSDKYYPGDDKYLLEYLSSNGAWKELLPLNIDYTKNNCHFYDKN